MSFGGDGDSQILQTKSDAPCYQRSYALKTLKNSKVHNDDDDETWIYIAHHNDVDGQRLEKMEREQRVETTNRQEV